MSRTSIDLDDRLVAECMRVFRCKSTHELVHLALAELLKAEKQKEALTESVEEPEPPLRAGERQESFRTALKEVNRRYGPALKKLAE